MINYDFIKTLIENKERLNSPLLHGNDEGAKFVRHEILKAHFIAKAMGLQSETKSLLNIYNNYFAHLGYTGDCIDLITRKFLDDTHDSLIKPLALHNVHTFRKMLEHLELFYPNELNSRFDLKKLMDQNNPEQYSQSFLRSILDVEIKNKNFIESKLKNCWITIDEIDTTPTYNGNPFYHLVRRHTDVDSQMSYKVYKKYR